MMCYLDRTFCCSPACVNKCGRKLTEEIKQGAKEWMGDNAPISVSTFCDKNGECEHE